MKHILNVILFACMFIACNSKEDDRYVADALAEETAYIYIDYVDKDGFYLNSGKEKNIIDIISFKESGEELIENKDYGIYPKYLLDSNPDIDVSKMYLRIEIFIEKLLRSKKVSRYELQWRNHISETVNNLNVMFPADSANEILFNGKKLDVTFLHNQNTDFFYKIYEYKDGSAYRYIGGMDTIAYMGGADFYLIIPVDTIISE